MRPKSRDRYEDGRAHRGDLNLDHGFPELLDAARAHGAAVAYERSRLAVPLRIDPVDRIFEHCRGAIVVFRGDENKPVRCGYCSGPAFDNLMLVRRTARHGRRHGLVKEGHRKVAKVEQLCFDSVALLEVLKNPLCGLFRKPALARAAYDYGDSRHVLFLCCLMRDRSLLTRRSDLVAREFTFGLEPILQVTAGF